MSIIAGTYFLKARSTDKLSDVQRHWSYVKKDDHIRQEKVVGQAIFSAVEHCGGSIIFAGGHSA
jgi:hypothetical protein